MDSAHTLSLRGDVLADETDINRAIARRTCERAWTLCVESNALVAEAWQTRNHALDLRRRAVRSRASRVSGSR